MGTGSDGQPRVVAFATDLTPLKKAEETIRKSEQRLRMALEGGRMGLWEWDAEGNRDFWDERVYELLGLDISVRPSIEKFLRHVDERDVEPLKENMQRSLADGGEFQAEFRLIRHSKEILWVASQGHTVRNASGKTIRVLGVLFDITQRKQWRSSCGGSTINWKRRSRPRRRNCGTRSTGCRTRWSDACWPRENSARARRCSRASSNTRSRRWRSWTGDSISCESTTAYAKADGRTPEFFKGKNHFALYPQRREPGDLRGGGADRAALPGARQGVHLSRQAAAGHLLGLAAHSFAR